MSARPFRILVICTGNRARSQMAQGWLRHLGGARVEVDSAGTDPKGVHPLATRVMGEVGIDISGNTSDHVDTYLGEDYDLVVTVCDAARESCPIFPGARRLLHRGFEDPDYPWMTEKELAGVFRGVRDDIGSFCRALVAREITGA
ncbi:MAG: arsenate reductase ArsC [Gammaproteobacteria bacterium]|nr:arsenate reductase ArsC [Gammaproteobacteria bacterium]